jgi:hypothetical protein
MALGDYLSSLNLDPKALATLNSQYGPPAPTQSQGDDLPDPYAMMTPENAARSRAASGGAAQIASATNPVAADPAWDPAVEKKKTAEVAAEKARSDADPQGPRGPDGFPTYRDLSTTGSAMQNAPAGPMHTIPGHWQPGTRSEGRQGTEFDPEMMGGSQAHSDVAAGHRLIAADKQLEAAQQQGVADAVYAAAHADASKRAADQIQALQVQKEQYIAKEQTKLADLSVAAQKQVDPEAAKGSGGAQMLAAIGIALGQFGASLNGGQNAALSIVNANIDRNIKAQEANIANAGKARDREASLYRQNLEAFGDKERATLATKMQYLEQVKGMADQQYAAAKNTANEGQYHSFIAGVNDEIAKTGKDWTQLTGVQVTKQANEHYQGAQTVGGPGAGQKGKEKLYVPALGGYARDEETARKLNGHGALRTQINEDLHTIHGLLTEAKGLNSVSDYGRMQEIRTQIDALKHGVLQKTTVLADQGAMSKGDQSVAEARSSLESVDPQLKTDAQIGRMQKALVNVAKSHQRDARLEGEAHGIQLGKEGYVQGPSGPEARAELAGRNKVVTKKTEAVDDLIEPPKGVVK